MSKLSITPELIALSDKIKEGLKVEDGKVIVDEKTYLQTLPDNVTVEVVKAVHEHNSQFYPAATRAFAEVATEAMKKDKKLESLDASFPLVGKDAFDLTFERKRTFPNPQGGEPTTTWGNIKAGVTLHSAKANRGVMNLVRDEASAAALAAFGK